MAGQWTVQLENDVTFYEDGNYTNGLLLSWQSDYIKKPVKDMHLPAFLTWQNKLLLSSDYETTNWGIKLSQRMWTPDEIKNDVPQPYDRPYAGLLEIELHNANYSNESAYKNWLSIGVIGPAAGAQKLQRLFHSTTGASSPNGWEYQVHNQAVFTYAYEIDKLIYRNTHNSNYQWEINGFGYGALSNVRSEANVGLMLKWGTNLGKTFGRESNHYGQTSNFTSLTESYDLSLFARGHIGYRFNDLTLDGDLPYETRVELQHPQGFLKLGAQLAFPNFSILWSVNGYTKDYQTDPDSWHGYGSLSLSWQF